MLHKDDVAKRLADAHFDIEPGITRIFKLEGQPESEGLPDTPIKLLEVNADSPPSGILPLYFGPVPDRGIPYPSAMHASRKPISTRLKNFSRCPCRSVTGCSSSRWPARSW